ncbi:MAG: HIT domain-containing protein [Candidatus Woesearchaeota archaeon]|jgi:histidine triad (HIT) family protein|nr:hypothetical protein [archaeon]MDP6548318.1 HIT domain-containing protein [Candidatus Woesearchaeota archaeon]MDP7263807.1 HIT domain-containing protein [Candidatus Woesearchaeota archaeon]MDP7622864.1 HIT domain-containing protein [Candidatus Woesearchaeota archaeon]HJN56876.1 HIT domain-containing protein [Candidatus Woesearchaeota archaeon]|tara:strand:- start:22960 stop:23718 length:759 start_codon:yes stop_codon:yes gene_type:complete
MAEQQQMSEEQVAELQEKIKNMSPEELKEFQKKQCIFCQIVSGKVQSRKVYEDENVLAILDINPANPGHILIMPKEHYSIMPQIPEDDIKHIFAITKSLSNASLRALEVQGSNIIVANGVAAGQRAQHFMAHLIPRKENDGVDFQVPQKTIPDKDLLEIKKILSESLGAKTEEVTEPVPRILPAPKKEVVEAEFSENNEIDEVEKPTKKRIKKDTKKKIVKPKTENKVTESKGEKSKEEIDLDDIAKVLGAK